MADIFISYSKAERGLTEALAQELEAHGYSVWWDTNLITGDSYQKIIVDELRTARAVIVIWTPNSTQSEWVYSEANRAARDKKLIPVRVPEVDLYDIPPPFDVRQTELLSNRRAIYAALARLDVRPADAAKVVPVEQPRPVVARQEPLPKPPSRAEAKPAVPEPSQSPPSQTRASRPMPVESARATPREPDIRTSPPAAPTMPRIAPARTAVTVVHWRRTRRHAASVLGIWLLISLAIHTVAAELNSIQFLSFPLGYYLAAQGSLIGLLALIGWFVWRQNRIDIDLARS